MKKEEVLNNPNLEQSMKLRWYGTSVNTCINLDYNTL